MLIKRLFFLFCVSSFIQLRCGDFGVRVVVPIDFWKKQKKEKIDIHSRKYLYEIIKHSPNFILTKEVKENREYYIKLMEQHIEYLYHKKNKLNYTEGKAYVIGTSALVCVGLLSAIIVKANEDIKAIKNNSFFNRQFDSVDADREKLIRASCSLALLPAAYCAATRLWKAIRYKTNIQKRINRDTHILNLLKQN